MTVIFLCQRKIVNHILSLQKILIIKTWWGEAIAIINKNLIEINTSSNKQSDPKFELNEKNLKLKKKWNEISYYKKGSKW
jgi:hypothetical protein